MIRYKNISLCQINVKTGQQDYYLPKNANWWGKVVEKVVIYNVPQQLSVVSPVDGQNIASGNDLIDLYLDFFNEEGQNIMHNVHAYQLSAVNNYPAEIKQKLSFELCRLHFTSAPQKDMAVMLYVFYETDEQPVEEPKENVTIRFSLANGQRSSFADIIEKYMYARNKGVHSIAIWNGVYPDGFHTGFITLRDKSGEFAHEDLPCYFFRPVEISALGDPILTHRIPLNVVEIDFNNSYLFNTTGTKQDYIITFYY